MLSQPWKCVYLVHHQRYFNNDRYLNQLILIFEIQINKCGGNLGSYRLVIFGKENLIWWKYERDKN